MNTSEFVTWLGYHMARFTGVAGWLAKFPARPRFEGDPTQLAVRDAWVDALHFVDLQDAMSATDALHRGEEELPKSFDDHPRYVKRLAGQYRAKRTQELSKRRSIDGEPTVKCPACQDYGNIKAWHKRSIKAARKGELFHATLNPEGKSFPYFTHVRCTCDAGRQPRNANFREFDGKFLVQVMDCDVSGSLEEAIKRNHRDIRFMEHAWRALMDEVAAEQVASEVFQPDDWA